MAENLAKATLVHTKPQVCCVPTSVSETIIWLHFLQVPPASVQPASSSAKNDTTDEVNVN